MQMENVRDGCIHGWKLIFYFHKHPAAAVVFFFFCLLNSSLTNTHMHAHGTFKKKKKKKKELSNRFFMVSASTLLLKREVFWRVLETFPPAGTEFNEQLRWIVIHIGPGRTVWIET